MNFDRSFFENLLIAIAFGGALYFSYQYSSARAAQSQTEANAKPTKRIKRASAKTNFSFFDPAPAPTPAKMSAPTTTLVSAVTSAANERVSETVSLIPLLQNDDICNLAIQVNEKQTRAQQLHDLFSVSGSSDEFGLLDSSPSPINGQINSQPTSDATRFYNALLAGNLLTGAHADAENTNQRKADHQLDLLKRARPQNAAYAYFQIATAWGLRHDLTEVQDLIRQASQGSEFETYSAKLMAAIYQAGLTNPSEYLLATVINSKFPVPDYSKSSTIIKQSNPDASMDRAIFDLSQLMKREAQEARTSDTQYGSSLIQYSVGRTLSIATDPGTLVPTYKQLMQTQFPNIYGQSTAQDIATAPDPAKVHFEFGTCIRRDFDDQFYKLPH